MKHLFPPTTAAPARIETWQHVQDYLEAHGPAYLLQALRTLRTHANDMPLASLPATRDWLDAHYPKARRGVHPRPELPQRLAAYKKLRADLNRAFAFASGQRAEKVQHDARTDGWAELCAAAKLHSRDGGLLHGAEAGSLAGLADIGRRAGIEPWQLAEPQALAQLEAAFAAPRDRARTRRSLQVLRKYAFIPELAALLPDAPLPELAKQRARDALPAHIEAKIRQMVERASMGRDEVTGCDSARVGKTRRDVFFAALRHHLRHLPQCPAEPALGYTQPVEDLAAVDDVSGLFALAHVKATIRRTAALEHLPDTLSQASAAAYYTDLLVVLARNGLVDDAFVRAVKTSRFLKEGRELAAGMRKKTRDWCEALLSDPERERRFRNLHRLLQAKAQQHLDTARAEGRDPFDAAAGNLRQRELTMIRALGTAAAASAVALAGRPLRMSNVLGLRLKGARANFFRPTRDRKDWRFYLPAAETKSGKEEPLTTLRRELHGPQVLSWYLQTIRPLFPHADTNIHLFPAVEARDARLGNGTFDLWFQRAASDASLPMTFHRWRHGYATLLLDESWDNLQVAADMLGNTVQVCARSYAWIDSQKLYAAGQDKLIERARAPHA